MGPKYLSVLRNFCNKPKAQQTFVLYQEQVLEHYGVMLLFSDQYKDSPLSNKGNKKICHLNLNSSKPSENLSRKQRPHCLNCNCCGYKRPECPEFAKEPKPKSSKIVPPGKKECSRLDEVCQYKKDSNPKSTQSMCAVIVEEDNEES